MANENELPIKIVIDASEAGAQVRRTFDEIKQAAEAAGRSISASFSNSSKDRQRGDKESVSSAKKSYDDSDAHARAYYERQKGLVQQFMEGNDKAYRQLARLQEQASRQNDVYSAAGVRSPQAMTAGIEAVMMAQSKLRQEFSEGKLSVGQYYTSMGKLHEQHNLFTEGNTRARGALHKFTAALASTAFEATGAVYAVTSLFAIATAPAAIGIKFAKSIEDARVGITGILVSMGELNGKAVGFTDAWKVSGEYVNRVHADSLRLGLDMSKLMEVNRAVMSGGLSSKMDLNQIRQVSAAGAVATSMLGLDSRQFVQEVRDIVNGGIQAASSTLANALGITNKMVAEWKKAGTQYEETMKRLQGFQDVAEKVRGSTLSGAWDMLIGKIGMLMNDKDGFNALKQVIIDVSNWIGKIDAKGFHINPELVTLTNDYWNILKSIGGGLREFTTLLADHSETVKRVAEAYAVYKVALLLQNSTTIKLIVDTAKLTATKLGLAEASVAVTAAANAEAAALSGVAAASTAAASSAKKGVLAAVGSRLGIIGVVLYGIYEAADAFGLIDLAFKSVEHRAVEAAQTAAKGARDAAATMSIEQAAGKRQSNTSEIAAYQMMLERDRTSGVTSKTQEDTLYGVAKIRAGQGDERSKRILQLMEENKAYDARLKSLAESAATEASMKGITSRFTSPDAGKAAKGANAGQTTLNWMQSEIEKYQMRDDAVLTNEEKATQGLMKHWRSMVDERGKLIGKTTQKDILQYQEQSPKLIEAAQGADRAAQIKKESEAMRDMSNKVDDYVKATRDATAADQMKLDALGKREVELRILQEEAKAQNEIKMILEKQNLSESDKLTLTEQVNQALKDRTAEMKRIDDITSSSGYGFNKAANDYFKSATDMAAQSEQLTNKIFKGMEDQLFSFVTTGKASFRSFVSDILKEMARIKIQQAIAGIVGQPNSSGNQDTGLLGVFGKLVMSYVTSGSGSAPTTTQALGGVWSQGVQYFANGGVVHRPTAFGTRSGIGVMGEAGAEAIMPLTRTSSGHLGVRAAGGATSGNNIGSVHVNSPVTVNIDQKGNANAQVNGDNAGQLGQALSVAVQQELLRQMRQGGILNPVR